MIKEESVGIEEEEVTHVIGLRKTRKNEKEGDS
jgi:hypothetical protein